MNKGLNYAYAAPKLLENGYEAIPIIPGTKRPPLNKWTDIDFLDPSEVSDFVVKYPKYGVGVKTGELVAIDLDIPDYDLADEFEDLCLSYLGHAPVRFGKSPKRTLFYKLDTGQLIKQMTPSYQAGDRKYQVEMLGAGQQSVVFGTHPDTQAPYYWVDDSLLDIPVSELTEANADQIKALKAAFEARLSAKFGNGQSRVLKPDPKPAMSDAAPAANSDRVVDALSYLDPQDYDTWVAVGHALKSSGRQDGLSIFQDWSAKRSDGSIPSNYVSHEDVATRFGKFKPSRTSLNAIFTRASGQGWKGANELFTSIVSHTSVARHILQLLCTNRPKPIFDEGQLWVYAATHWESYSESDQRRLVQDLDGIQIGKKQLAANKSFIDGVLNELHSMCEHAGFFASPTTGVNLQNGFLRISKTGERKLEAHKPSHARRHTIDATWDESQTYAVDGNLKKLLDGCFGTSDEAEKIKRLVFQIIGVACASLATSLAEPKAFVLYGPTAANGKSQILDLIRYLLPQEAISCVPPGDFGKEQFIANLIGKAANLSDELSSSRAIASDKMKQVVTGDMVNGKIVYRPPVPFRPQAINIFATNSLPSFQGGVDSGVERRLSVIPFDTTIPKSERVVGIGKTVAVEQTNQVIALAITQLCEVIKRGYFEIPETVEETTTQWFHDADLVLGWLEDGGLERHIIKKPIPCKLLYVKFKEDVRDLADGGFIPGHRRFVETLRANLKNDSEFELVRLSDGNAVRRRSLV